MIGKCPHENCGGDIYMDQDGPQCFLCGRSPEPPPAHVQPSHGRQPGARAKRKYTKRGTAAPPGRRSKCDICELKAELEKLTVAFDNYRQAIRDLGGSHAR